MPHVAANLVTTVIHRAKVIPKQVKKERYWDILALTWTLSVAMLAFGVFISCASEHRKTKMIGALTWNGLQKRIQTVNSPRDLPFKMYAKFSEKK